MANRDWKPTACILCECNCGIEVELGGEGGRHLVRLRGDRNHPVSRGYTCEKALRLDHYQHARDRLTTPLRRKADGTFEPIDWDTAIREVSSRLASVQRTHGGDAIFYYGGGGQGNHLPGAYATATRRALGSRYRSSALAQEKTGEFWVSERMMGSITRADFEHCDVALFLGKNPWHSHSIPRARVTLKEIASDLDERSSSSIRGARRRPSSPTSTSRSVPERTRGCSRPSWRSSSRKGSSIAPFSIASPSRPTSSTSSPPSAPFRSRHAASAPVWTRRSYGARRA